MKKTLSIETQINHSSYTPPEGFRSYAEPMYRGSTVLFKNLEELRARSWLSREGYSYGLHGTPTTFTLEAQLAEIEGGNHALLTPSGLSAISVVDLAFLKAGDDMLVPDDAYNPNQDMGRWLAKNFGISVRFYDPMIGAGIAGLIQENTKLIIEAQTTDDIVQDYTLAKAVIEFRGNSSINESHTDIHTRSGQILTADVNIRTVQLQMKRCAEFLHAINPV